MHEADASDFGRSHRNNPINRPELDTGGLPYTLKETIEPSLVLNRFPRFMVK